MESERHTSPEAYPVDSPSLYDPKLRGFTDKSWHLESNQVRLHIDVESIWMIERTVRVSHHLRALLQTHFVLEQWLEASEMNRQVFLALAVFHMQDDVIEDF